MFRTKQLSRKVKKHTAELIESEARFRATFEQAAVGIAHVSLEGRFLRINQKFCDIVGYSEGEMLDLTFQDITHPDDLDADLEYVKQVLKGVRETYSMDKRYYRKDGSVVWINLTVSLVFDRGGQAKYFVSAIKDISDRKQAEEALHQNLDFLEHLTSSVPDAIFFITMPERTIKWANDSFNVLGYEPEEYVGQSTKKYYANPEDYDAVGDLQRDAIRKGDDMISTEVMVRRKDGKVIPVELTATFYREEGKLSNITAMVRDITKRKQAEEALIESEEKFRALVTGNEEIIYIIDKDGTFVLSEGKGLSKLGLQPGQVVGKSVFELYKDYPQMLDSMRNALNGETITTEVNVDGNYFSNWYTPHKNQSGEIIGILGLSVNITEHKLAENKLYEAYTEIEKLQKQLQAESAYLQDEIKLEHNFENIIGNSNAIQYVLFKVEQVAGTDSSVLVLGETGTGKELIARAIHHNSLRSARPLIKINCATLPANLIESELFGHERGSFTGAHTRHAGRFEVADGSSIFLDEIGELPLELQAKLLRVIEDGEFERLGSSKTMKVDVRIIAATNRDLEKDVREGRFRQDLWYRLNVYPITLPPLRERVEDIPLIVQYYVDILARKMGKDIASVPAKVMKALQSYEWPGNVRELANVLERAVISTSGSKLRLSEELKLDYQTSPESFKSLHDMERDYIVKALEKTNWKVSGKNSAAEILRLQRSTLRAKMKKLGIDKP